MTKSSIIKLTPLTSLIASKPAPVGKIVSAASTPSAFAKFLIVSSADATGAAISSGPPREPGGGNSYSIPAKPGPLLSGTITDPVVFSTNSPPTSSACLKDIKPSLSKFLVLVAMSVILAGTAGGS